MKKAMMMALAIPLLSFAASNTPIINSVTLTGPDLSTVQIDGTVFLAGGRVELRDPESNNDIIGRYFPSEFTLSDLGGGLQRINFDLRPLDAATLRVGGELKFYVVNPPGNGSTQPAWGMLKYSGAALPYPGRDVLPVASGGSVYTLYDIGAYADAIRPTPEEVNTLWYFSDTNNMKSAVGMYHIDPGAINSQLEDMYNQGQRRIALFVGCRLGVPANQVNSAGLFGPYMVGTEDANGIVRLAAQSESNYRNLLAKIAELGFKEVGIRFGTPKEPRGTAWDDPAVRAMETGQNWEFLSYYRGLTESILKPAGVSRYYDLGPERAGSWDSSNWIHFEEYTEAIWSNYWASAGTAYDTFGFSFATSPGRVNAMLEVYNRVGHFPPFYGFDMYAHLFRKLAFVRDELAQWGQEKKPIMLEETFYDDPQNLLELDAARKLLGLNILYVNQWPLRRDFLALHYTEDYPRDYSYTRADFDSLCPDMTGYTANSALNISSISGAYDPVSLLPKFHIAASGLAANVEVALVLSKPGPITGDDILAVYDPSSFTNASTFVQDGYIDLVLDRAAANVVETAAYRASIDDPSFVLLKPGAKQYSSQRFVVPFVELPRPQITKVVRSGAQVWVWGKYFGSHAYLNLWDVNTTYKGLDVRRVDQSKFDIIKIYLSDADAARLDVEPAKFYVVNQGATFTQETSVFSPAYTFP